MLSTIIPDVVLPGELDDPLSKATSLLQANTATCNRSQGSPIASSKQCNVTLSRKGHRKGRKFVLQRTQMALARENYLRPLKTDSGPFLDAPSPLNKNKGGADAAGSGGQRPQRGSIRRAEGSDRGSGRLPAGDVCARRRRRQAGAHYFLPLWGFPPPEALKALS